MAVPDFQSFFRPMLEALLDGTPRTIRTIREELRRAMSVSEADFQEMLPSGARTRFADRVYWANTHLYQAGLIARPSSGVLAITDRGRNLLKAKRWKESVGVDRIYAFAGSLEVKKATKGVILTTSSFTDGARKALQSLGKRVVLIDGDELVRLMMSFGLGVRTIKDYAILAPDADAFDAFEG